MNTVERVARAISLNEWFEGDSYNARRERDTWMKRARAAIEVMAQSTDEEPQETSRMSAERHLEYTLILYLVFVLGLLIGKFVM